MAFGDLTTIKVTIQGAGAYSQSRRFVTEKPPKRPHDEFDEQHWREHMHVDESGDVYIPGVQIKNAIVMAASYLGEKIPGRGNKTYKDFLTAGLMVEGDFHFNPRLKADQVKPEKVDCMAQPSKPNSGRVWRLYPRIPSGWIATGRMILLDPAIPMEVLRRHLDAAGKYIGIGRWRAIENGENGRFSIEQFEEA